MEEDGQQQQTQQQPQQQHRTRSNAPSAYTNATTNVTSRSMQSTFLSFLSSSSSLSPSSLLSSQIPVGLPPRMEDDAVQSTQVLDPAAAARNVVAGSSSSSPFVSPLLPLRVADESDLEVQDDQDQELLNRPLLLQNDYSNTYNSNNNISQTNDTPTEQEHNLSLMMPLIMASEDSMTESGSIRSRNTTNNNNNATTVTSASHSKKHKHKRRKHNPTNSTSSSSLTCSKLVGTTTNSNNTNSNHKNAIRRGWCWLCPAPFVRSTLTVMNFLARVLFWCTVVATVAAIGWYSYELKNNGTDPHLIAWFSAGAFVLLGFPISMYGIVMHLANYNQPNIQMYIVRILWMIPIYSMESWLCLRFHRYAIYIETLRDVYESYVLYSFLQFLIQVLGGEEQLIYMLKDKSPTRGVHMWGLQWCVKPWLMGQPVSSTRQTNSAGSGGTGGTGGGKSVQWTSPFFVRCKFGVLQYVLLKFVTSIFVMILELNGLYKEGDFSLSSGYLYICFLTNFSQCWALYCLIFFYLATKNELGPIRPVGKFLSVKALVFFTWWQSLFISLIYQMDLIPHYHASNESEWTSEDVAKGLQDYLICIEMFVGAIVHVFVFPHTDYLPEAVQARRQSFHHLQRTHRRQLGRKRHHTMHGTWNAMMMRDDLSAASKNSGDVELASHATLDTLDHHLSPASASPIEEEPKRMHIRNSRDGFATANDDDDDDNDDGNENDGLLPDDSDYSEYQSDELTEPPPKTGFVKALIDSTIPRDFIDQSVGIVKGEYMVEKKSLLNHAATSDQYDLFSSSRRFLTKATKQLEGKE